MEYQKIAGQQSIGEAALTFYLLNHAVSLINQKNLPDAVLPPKHQEIYDLYHRQGGAIGVRMYHDTIYMLTTMCSFTKPDSYHLEVVGDLYGAQALNVMQELCGSQQSNTWWTPNYAKNRPHLTKAADAGDPILADLLGALTYILDVRQKDLAYGPLWRDVGRMMTMFVNGARSLENTIDNAYTFCHCNGSFFEKGSLFQAVGNDLFEILDVQHAGYIPQLAGSTKNRIAQAPGIQALHKTVTAAFPELKGDVPWAQVKRFTQNTLTFHNKYQKNWNAFAGAGGGGGGAQPADKPKPKIFMPVTEDSYEDMLRPAGPGHRPGFKL